VREPASRTSWQQAWWRALTEIGSVTPERRGVVLEDIREGSNPTAIYYALLGISELIAGFALIVDSDATLIGANVVAPLMTPIFGVSLGLMRGELRLLSRALRAEFGGAAFGVALCFALGSMPFMGEPSEALLAQTRPTLIDLFVASLAGFAGVLAMIDERISPALPGVAIATALNPPIAAIGLCLACGAYQGAWGAFVLFFANVLAILVVGAVLFLVSGFVTRAEIGSLGGLARRFAAALIGLALVAGLLTSYLYRLVQTLRTESAISAVLDEALAREPNTALVKVEFSRGEGGVAVISTVNTPRVLDPERVKRMEDELRERLGEPVRLFLRCSVTKDVSATGSTNIRPYLNLDGKVTEAPLTPSMRLLQQAEQVAREVASTRPNLHVIDVQIVELESRPVVVISLESTREPKTRDVARFERMLQDRLGEPSLRVVVRRNTTTDLTSKGPILLGEAHFGTATPEEEARRAAAEQAVRSNLEAIPNMFAEAVDAVLRDGGWSVRAEVVGPRVLTPSEVRGVEVRSAKAIGAPVVLIVWARAELQVTGQRYEILGQRADSAPEPAPRGGS
jgi:uncharacterized hydrophobic protein (TIGR00271 family)